MKKKIVTLIIAILVLAILLIPIPMRLKDGGTVVWSAIAYRVIVWNTLDGKTGTEVHIFPTNFSAIN